ncbi:hypothetical protein N9V27_01530 [bacterium]|jgi:hypothetical protein|nr:hypothetical protein [bacterium]
MKDWNPYIKAGWELVTEATSVTPIYLDPEIEHFLVFTIARTIERNDIGSESVAIKILEARSIPRGRSRQPILRAIGEECLFIDAWDIKKRKWPSMTYYSQMGQIAFMQSSLSTRPNNELLEKASNSFTMLSKVLKSVRDLAKF